MSTFGLVGTITSDTITYDDGRVLKGLGGILYQAAVFCGLGEEVFLYSNCGQGLKAGVRPFIEAWSTLYTNGLEFVPGSGNQVFLRYSDRLKEREEVLEFAVPSLNPAKALDDLGQIEMLLAVFNSGFDITLSDWRKIADSADCPIWLDVHSLALAKHLHKHREYISLADWREWVKGAAYLQANRQEVACMLGHPQRWPEEGEIEAFVKDAFKIGVRAVFVTMGKEGVLVSTPAGSQMMRAPRAKTVVDTTGCGDVFCAGTMHRLGKGAAVAEAASFGIHLASQAVSLAGVTQTYDLASKFAKSPILKKHH
jgi:sugar/nucleoside kinase (ribokinase family)